VISASGRKYQFNFNQGQLLKVFLNNKEFINTPLIHNIWRAPTDNDRGGSNEKSFYDRWIKAGYNNLSRTVESVNYKTINEEKIQVSVEEKYSNQNSELNVNMIYNIFNNGDLHLEVETNINPILPVLPKIGLSTQIPSSFSNIEWYGRGPYESYPDRKLGSLIGKYNKTVDELYFPYIKPQENGNRTDVRWISIGDSNGNGIIIFGENNYNFSAHRYSIENLTAATHTNEIKNENYINLNIDFKMMGVGGDDSWNPRTHKEFLIEPDKYKYSYIFRFTSNLGKDLQNPFFKMD